MDTNSAAWPPFRPSARLPLVPSRLRWLSLCSNTAQADTKPLPILSIFVAGLQREALLRSTVAGDEVMWWCDSGEMFPGIKHECEELGREVLCGAARAAHGFWRYWLAKGRVIVLIPVK